MISHTEWTAKTEAQYWRGYTARRTPLTKARMAVRQIRELQATDRAAARRLAERLVADTRSDTAVVGYGLTVLSKMLVDDGDADGAMAAAVEAALAGWSPEGTRSWSNREHIEWMVELFLTANLDGWFDRVIEALDVIDGAQTDEPPDIRARRDLLRAAVLWSHGDASGATIGAKAFDVLKNGCGFTVPRTIERTLFAATRRGGTPRIFGMLGADSRLTPERLVAGLGEGIYFNDAVFERSSDRVVVDLTEFSLDFRWFDDVETIGRVRSRYDAFPFEDRRHIPSPPDQPAHAFMVLGVGDDVSRPDIVNPMIDLACFLNGEECVFLRVGPLSRRDDAPGVVAITTGFVDALIRKRLKPLFLSAGFTASGARRFFMERGDLGHFVDVQFSVYKDLQVELFYLVYYRDLVADDALARHRDKLGEFRPKKRLHTGIQYLSSPINLRWRPSDPSAQTVETMVEQIAQAVTEEWLPLFERTADARAELAHVLEQIEARGVTKVHPRANRFGAMTDAVLGAEMARLLGDSELERRFAQFRS